MSDADDLKLKLAITTIGDLLIENKLTQVKDNIEIKDINLVIPPYQRPYKWTAKNVMQLINDIINAKNENKEIYRVGTLILYNKKDKDGKDTNDYEIVDGQQRIISFSLLLLCSYVFVGNRHIAILNFSKTHTHKL